MLHLHKYSDDDHSPSLSRLFIISIAVCIIIIISCYLIFWIINNILTPPRPLRTFVIRLIVPPYDCISRLDDYDVTPIDVWNPYIIQSYLTENNYTVLLSIYCLVL